MLGTHSEADEAPIGELPDPEAGLLGTGTIGAGDEAPTGELALLEAGLLGTGTTGGDEEAPTGEFPAPGAGDVETSDVPLDEGETATGVEVVSGTAIGVELDLTTGTTVVVVWIELAGQLSTVDSQLVMTTVEVEYWVSSMVEGAEVVTTGADVVDGVVGTTGVELLGCSVFPGTVLGT